MPKRNVIRLYGVDQFYHVYNRGNNRRNIFLEPEDYYYFEGLLKRYLSKDVMLDSSGRFFLNFSAEIELVSFCLMSNHFHLLLYLKETSGAIHLMQSLMTAYTMYFNKKYKQSGKLYEGVYLASMIDSEQYLWQVASYIHLNPIDAGYNYLNYKYSSINYLTKSMAADWLHCERLLEDCDVDIFLKYLSDHRSTHDEIKYFKNILASPY